jgi:hypothetical protein
VVLPGFEWVMLFFPVFFATSSSVRPEPVEGWMELANTPFDRLRANGFRGNLTHQKSLRVPVSTH